MTRSDMRASSNFDTHIMMQQREKYFDKVGVDGASDNSFKAESRRLSRGLSNMDLSATSAF